MQWRNIIRWQLSMTYGCHSHRDKTKERQHGALKRDQRHYFTGAARRGSRQVKAAERSTAFSLPTPTMPSMRSLSWNACYLRRSTPMRMCVRALDLRIRPWRGERVGICVDRWPTWRDPYLFIYYLFSPLSYLARNASFLDI